MKRKRTLALLLSLGIDFPAGKYDIVAVSGGGNVSSSNAFDGGINAVMGT